jgi:hypothetical protein
MGIDHQLNVVDGTTNNTGMEASPQARVISARPKLQLKPNQPQPHLPAQEED